MANGVFVATNSMLPGSLKAPLQECLKKVKAIYEKDLAAGWGRVLLPDASNRKYPNAPREWRWQGSEKPGGQPVRKRTMRVMRKAYI